MANCNDLFQHFYKQIVLTPSKTKNLIKARGAIREEIRKYFSETLKTEKTPTFYGQGSYIMQTMVNPISGEYDIDDGVYLQNLDSDKSKWKNPETVHGWICDAVKNHTKEKPQDKRTCVRVIYTGEYHVDLPIYCINGNKPYLAEKGEAGWHVSDPRAIRYWFDKAVKQKGGQLQKTVQYFKAWADNKSKANNFPKSLVLTVLVEESFVENKNDDVSFAGTIKNMNLRLKISTNIMNPAEDECLSDRITPSEMENLKEKLSILVDKASDALKSDNKKDACKKWRSELGERFANCDEIDEDNKKACKFDRPALLHDDARSAR